MYLKLCHKLCASYNADLGLQNPALQGIRASASWAYRGPRGDIIWFSIRCEILRRSSRRVLLEMTRIYFMMYHGCGQASMMEN